MHVDEDDVASRVGEGGVRSGKDLAPRPDWGDLRWREWGGVGAGGVDTASAIGGDRGRPRLGLERRREDEPLEPKFKRVRTMMGPL